MDDNRTDLEKATAQVEGLGRFLRARLLKTMTLLFFILLLFGGIIISATPSSHFLETTSICLGVAAAFAAGSVVHYFQIVRSLHNDPVREVARLHKKRSVRNAGFVDAAESTEALPHATRRESDYPGADAYGAMRDIDVLGQKSDDGVNRTDDPSRGPIE
jgi:hypothetical protein